MADRTDRRSVLAGGATLCGLALAGCLGDDGGDASDEPDNETDSDPAANDTDPDDETDDGDDETDEPVDEWPMFQFDAGHAGAHDGEAPTDGVEEDWQTDLDAAALTAPVIAEDTVAVCSEEGGVYALDRDDGEERWSAEVATVEERTYLYDLTDLVPAISGERLFVPSADGMHGFDLETGDEEWFVATPELPSVPTVFGDAVAFTDRDGTVLVHDAHTGEYRWEYGIHGRNASFTHPPVVTDDHLFVERNYTAYPAERDPDLRFLQRAEIDDDGPTIRWTPVVQGSTWYLSGNEGTVRSYEEDDLEFTRRWTQQLDVDEFEELRLAASEDYVAVVGEGTLFVLDAEDGSQLWTTGPRISMNQIPIIAGNRCFVIDGSSVYAYDLNSGDRVWQREEGTERITRHQISVTGGFLYLGGEDGIVTAWAEPESSSS